MNAGVRDVLARAIYESNEHVMLSWWLTWEELRDDSKDLFRAKAEATIAALDGLMPPEAEDCWQQVKKAL